MFFPDSHFLKLPNYEGILGPISRNVNPSPPDEHIIHCLRSHAPRFAQRDEGDKSSIPAALFAFFCGTISLPQVVELIKTRKSHDDKAVHNMRTQFRTNKVELRIPRLPHPKHAFLTQQALASGSQAPPAPAAPLITPCQRALLLTLLLHRNSINLPRLEVRLRKDLHRRLHIRRPLFRAYFLPSLANLPPGMSTDLLRPLADLPTGRPLGHTLIKDLPLQPVKAKALIQGKARATASPTLMWLAKAKKAKKVKRARRVKRTHRLGRGSVVVSPHDWCSPLLAPDPSLGAPSAC